MFEKELVDRRELLKFLGAGTIALSSLSLISCSSKKEEATLFPSFKDDLVLAPGLESNILITFGDSINASEVFGFNNDYIDIIPISNSEVMMWVNHEYFYSKFFSKPERNKENVNFERSMVGGSLIKCKKEDQLWKVQVNDPINKGFRGNTPIPFHNGVIIDGKNQAAGTVANCAGGKTPWDTFLSCEENYDKVYGDYEFNSQKLTPSLAGWEKVFPESPRHYGWVVEINPKTGNAKKLISLGRFSHESATCIPTKNGKVAVYSGDDKEDEFIYKFISDDDKTLDRGVLYCADLKQGQWLPLDIKKSPELAKTFKTQLDVLINTRVAAKILGATPLDRPEDIAIHPKTGDVYIALSNNKPKGVFHGSILKLSELGGDHSALSFKSETYLMGGTKNGFSCPDNLTFDRNGNLWFSNDISGRNIGDKNYKPFGNNGLFVIPIKGDNKGKVIQVASAPVDAELTGLCFSPDQKELFVSVQHPGEETKDIKKPTSTWPTGKIPKPAIVVLSGPFIEMHTV